MAIRYTVSQETSQQIESMLQLSGSTIMYGTFEGAGTPATTTNTNITEKYTNNDNETVLGEPTGWIKTNMNGTYILIPYY